MPRYSKKDSVSEQTKSEAMSIAKGTQKPGQTKEQTRLIAQGIQKGIEHYKKQQKAKARELDKQLKKAKTPSPDVIVEKEIMESTSQTPWLPWLLLGASWLGFIMYTLTTR